jgi:hypothetical protein
MWCCKAVPNKNATDRQDPHPSNQFNFYLGYDVHFHVALFVGARVLIHDSQAPDPRAKQGKTHAGKSESGQDIYPRSVSNGFKWQTKTMQ